MVSSNNMKGTRSESDAESSSPDTARRPKTIHEQPSSIRLQKDEYTVAWICALPIEMAVARAMLDSIHESLPTEGNDNNAYILGNIGQHSIAVACLPSHQYGTTNAAVVASNLLRSFPSIRVGLMVGIGGGVPGKIDLRLGDIVVGCRVMEYDLGKVVQDGRIQRTGHPRIPRTELLTAISKLRAIHELTPPMVPSLLQKMHATHPRMAKYVYPGLSQDQLFEASFTHHPLGASCDSCDTSMLVKRTPRADINPKIHYGAIASGNKVIKDGIFRDKLAQELDVMCFEMEAAGLMDILPCLAIRGICDYSDSHKNKQWQEYAAAAAAAYAKELLLRAIPVTAINRPPTQAPTDPGLEKLRSRRKDLLNSLRFDQIDSRRSNIKTAHAKTCK